MWQIVMNTFITCIGTIAVFISQSLWKENRALKMRNQINSKNEHKITKEALCCLLRKELISDHDKYIEREEIPSYAYENYCRMYDSYHNLGGNGLITGMKEEIDNLPIKRRKQ